MKNCRFMLDGHVFKHLFSQSPFHIRLHSLMACGLIPKTISEYFRSIVTSHMATVLRASGVHE